MLAIAYGFDSFVDALLLYEAMKDLGPNALCTFLGTIIIVLYGR